MAGIVSAHVAEGPQTPVYDASLVRKLVRR